MALHARVVRSAATLGHGPVDVLVGILDVASLAVHAVLSVDDIARSLRLLQPFVHPGGAVAAGRGGMAVVLGGLWGGGICEPQVDGLVLLVVGAREGDVGQPVKGENTVGLGIGNGLMGACHIGCREVGL